MTLPVSFGTANDPRLLRGRQRLRVLVIGFTVAFASVGLQLLHMTPAPPTIPIAAASTAEEKAERRRPDIVDRDGRLLATDLRMPSIFADPWLIADRAAAAKQLARVLAGVDADELTERLGKARRFAWVKHEVTPREQEAVLQQGIPGVGFKFADHRVYPNGRVAGHVLGFVDIDNRGLAGIEWGMDHGRVGDAETPARLSLDLRVQEVVADELGQALLRFKAKGACGIVLDRQSGELIALVSLPDFDPNHAGTANAEQRINRCSGGTYELGSIFKIVAHANALDTGKVTLRDRFDASGQLVIGKFHIRDDHAKNRTLTVPEIFIYSSNIGTARMTFAAGGARPLDAFLHRAGFYQKLNLEIPEVALGQLPRRWADVTTATVSFGHGIALSPLQFLTAVSAIAGDGSYLPPTLLRRDAANLPPRTRLVAPSTAEDIRAMMWLTVMKGTGTKGRVDGYLVGGKTGTAEKAGHHGYRRDAVLASFAAVFPIEAPRYIVLAMLDEPHGDTGTYGHHYGGWTAAPTVSAIISRIGPLLGVQRSPDGAELAFKNRVEPGRLMAAGSREVALATERAAR